MQQQQQRSSYGPLSGTTRMSRYQKIHSPTHHPDHHPMFIIFHLVQSIASVLFKLPPPHIPYVSSPNQCLLFATHAHTIASCFAVVSRVYHLCAMQCKEFTVRGWRTWYSM